MKNLFKSLAAFQQEVPAIHKGTSGYGYSYAGLPEIFEVISPLLKKHGLGFTQLVTGETIKTILFHPESGENIESECIIPQGVQLAKMNEFQVAGSAITYYRRYTLSAMLGLVTDSDIDAAGKQIKKASAPAISKDKVEAHKFVIDSLETKKELKDYFDKLEPAEKTALKSHIVAKGTKLKQ